MYNLYFKNDCKSIQEMYKFNDQEQHLSNTTRNQEISI